MYRKILYAVLVSFLATTAFAQNSRPSALEARLAKEIITKTGRPCERVYWMKDLWATGVGALQVVSCSATGENSYVLKNGKYYMTCDEFTRKVGRPLACSRMDAEGPPIFRGGRGFE